MGGGTYGCVPAAGIARGLWIANGVSALLICYLSATRAEAWAPREPYAAARFLSRYLQLFNESTPMNTTGHRRLANGSLLRLDFEHGRYVGTLYTADLAIEREFKAASIEHVSRQMKTWI